MRLEALVSFILVGRALSSPARRGCGQKKCYDAVNECGMKYGGCWTECSDGLTKMPTFTAPLCASSTDIGHPARSSDADTSLSSTTVDPAKSQITSPPTLEPTATPTSCVAMWLCVDYLAVCGNLRQMYGGCYDICTSSPPVTSPLCSLSSSTTESGYAIATPTPEPGAAYTEKPATDNIDPAIDDSKAMVMAEMSDNDATAVAPAPATEFRLANANTEEAPTSPATEALSLVEAPANLRGAAIAKLQADKIRKPNTDNVPCWDKDTCREVQLGIPSPAPSQSPAEASSVPTAESSTAPTAEPSTAPTEESSTAPTAEPMSSAPADASTEAPNQAPAEAPADAPAEELVEAPA